MSLLIILIGFETTEAKRNNISLGLHTQIAPFMWKDGKSLKDFGSKDDHALKRWAFLQSNLDKTSFWGGQWNIVTVRQWMDGEDNFDRLLRIVEEHEKRGLKIVLRVIEDPLIFERLLETESTEFGFDQSYFEWVRALANVLGNKVQCFLIGNESELDQGPHYRMWKNDAPAHVVITYDLYAKVLKTAVMAIKSVDSLIQVANCGFSDMSLALAVANSIYNDKGIDDAFELWKDWRRIGGKKIGSKTMLFRWLKNPEKQRRIEFLQRAIREPMGSDLFQIHYYGGWRALQRMLEWVRKEMQEGNVERPIIAAEVGYTIRTYGYKKDDGSMRWVPDWNYYSEYEHAQNTIKNFSILFGNGVRMALYWHMRESNKNDMAVRLFPQTENPNDFKPNIASFAFRMLGATLNGSRPTHAKLPSRPGLKEFRFIGSNDVSIIWSDGEDVSAQLRKLSSILDIEGRALNDDDNSSSLLDPLYVIWPLDESPITPID